MWLAQNGMADPDNAGAGAYAYMDLMGLVSLGWMWLKMAARRERRARRRRRTTAHSTTPSSSPPASTPQRELPLSTALRRKIEAGAETLMKIPAEAF